MKLGKATADLGTGSLTKAVQRAQAAGAAAAAGAADAARSAAGAAGSAVSGTTSAAGNAAEAAQTAAVAVRENVRGKVLTARKWAAPRLETAADYTASTVAPKVAAALRTTARQVEPDPGRSRRKIALWSLAGAGLLAGLGAAAALFRSRFKAAIAADSETADEEVVAEPPDHRSPAGEPVAETTAGDGTEPGDGGPDAADASANGRVNSAGR